MQLHRETIYFCLFLALALVGCGGPSNEPGAGPGMRPPAKVTIAQPLSASITEWTEYTGRLEPVESVELKPRSTGYIVAIHFEEGKRVEKGQLLFQIDPEPYQAALDEAQARVAQAEASRSLAESLAARARQLLETNSIAPEEADRRINELLRTEADLKAARALEKSAAINLGYSRIEAPISGIAGQHLLTVGNLVQSGANAPVLTTIVPQNPVRAVFHIDESRFLRNVRRFLAGNAPGREQKGRLRVQLQLDDEEDWPREGSVDFIDNRIDPRTATLRVSARFDNPDGLLTPGQFVRVRMAPDAARPAMLLPDAALAADQNVRFVWTVSADGTAMRRDVVAGRLHRGLRVIEAGLNASDQVVIQGTQMLFPGAPVEATESEVTYP